MDDLPWTPLERIFNWINGKVVGSAANQIQPNQEFDNLYTGLNTLGTALDIHAASGDHDSRYFTQTQLNNGQLDTRYHTKAELTGGALDTRYYTEAEVDGKLQGIVAGQVPDNSVGPEKLTFDPATQAELDAVQAQAVNRGTANPDVQQVMALLLATDTRSLIPTTWNADNKPTAIEIRNGAAVVGAIAITYNADNRPTSMVVTAGGKTITYTVAWTGDRWTGTTKAVV